MKTVARSNKQENLRAFDLGHSVLLQLHTAMQLNVSDGLGAVMR